MNDALGWWPLDPNERDSRSTIRPPPHVPLLLIGQHEVVRALAATTTCAIDHAVTRGPFGFARDVVLKRVLPGLPRDVAASSAERLLHEAAALARLSHPAIVRLYEVVEHEGSPVLVLEHVDGLTLARLVDDLHARGAALDDACAFYIGHRVASALASAHEASPSVSHGDVAPGNVLISWDGHVKLVDFDLVHGSSPTGDVVATCRLVQDLLFRAGNVTSDPSVALATARPDLHPTVLVAIARGLRHELTAAQLEATLRAVIDVETVRERLVSRLQEAPRARWSYPPAPVAPIISSLAPVAVQPRLSDISTVKTRRKGSRAALTTSVAALVLAAVAVGGAVLGRKYAHVLAPPPPTTTLASEAPPAEALSLPSATHDAAPTDESTDQEGRIVTAPSESDHRIFVDGRALGHEGQPITVRCGKHVVKIGTAGTPRNVDVPCGGEIRVTR